MGAPDNIIMLKISFFIHQECAYDYVTIYDGASADEKTLGLFCGNRLPHPIVASQNQMYVVFKSDGSVQRSGFLANHSTGKLGFLVHDLHNSFLKTNCRLRELEAFTFDGFHHVRTDLITDFRLILQILCKTPISSFVYQTTGTCRNLKDS